MIGRFALLIDTWTTYLEDLQAVTTFLDHAEKEVKEVKGCLLPVSEEGSLAVGKDGEKMTSLPSVLLKRIAVRWWRMGGVGTYLPVLGSAARLKCGFSAGQAGWKGVVLQIPALTVCNLADLLVRRTGLLQAKDVNRRRPVHLIETSAGLLIIAGI